MFKLFNIEESNNSSNYSDIVNVSNLHNKNIYGDNVTIAIIDTGCDYNNKLLKDKIIGGYNFTSEDTPDNYMDYNGHGTHVAGVIAAGENDKFKSIAPHSNLLILKALDGNGRGSMANIISAIDYAIKHNVDIINMSLGSNKGTDELHKIIEQAIENNISVVCAAGNEGDNNPDTEELDFPSCYEEVIEVGAMDNNYNISKFSNSNKYVDIIAPGEDICSTYLLDEFKCLTGTSMATPIISGILALLIQWSKTEFNRRLSEKEVYALLIKNTKELNINRSFQGYGYIYLNL